VARGIERASQVLRARPGGALDNRWRNWTL
jgi:hypothetical protein